MKVLSDVSILVAVGLNGDAVAVTMLEGDQGLARKLANEAARAAFAPLLLPVAPGLYWFAGRCGRDPSPRGRQGESALIDGEFIPLGAAGDEAMGLANTVV